MRRMEHLYQTIAEICKDNALTIDIDKIVELDKYTPHNSSFFCVINPRKLSFEFISKGMSHCLGFDEDFLKDKGLGVYWSRIHTNDLNELIVAWKELRHYMLQDIPSKTEKHISYAWNYRIKNSEEKYINIVQNITPIRCSSYPNLILILTYYTIINSNVKMRVSATANIQNDHIYIKKSFCDNSKKILLSNITPRERDIIDLLALHHTSKEIGDRLCISPNTVNTHRRNIIKKLKVASTGEVIGLLNNN